MGCAQSVVAQPQATAGPVLLGSGPGQSNTRPRQSWQQNEQRQWDPKSCACKNDECTVIWQPTTSNSPSMASNPVASFPAQANRSNVVNERSYPVSALSTQLCPCSGQADQPISANDRFGLLTGPPLPVHQDGTRSKPPSIVHSASASLRSELLTASSVAGGIYSTDSEGGSGFSEWSLQVDTLGFGLRRFLEGQLGEAEQQVIRGMASEFHHITLSNAEISELGIDRDARFFAFCYPIVTERPLKLSAKDGRSPDIALLAFGGFMYFDSDMVLKDVRAVMSAEHVMGAGGRRQPLAARDVAGAAGARCALLHMAVAGRGGQWNEALPDGGFAYIFHEPSEKAVVQAKLDIFFPIEDAELNHGKGCPKCSRILEWSDFSQGLYEAGWTCENYMSCGQAWTEDSHMRYFCSHCQADFCEACHAALRTGGHARTLLH
eukprot:CAMPEP_0115765726 /NCGR_PEP_ID=MMETSP0272-20121206/102743_1 /TAXON_ID=71861 /ORGANISM="Scrippsiella trochoidea, Strain CCMP3099" /LENGTH=434 /DNA_ID=CAMNT_0003211591 /DNA_START=46 /DNA_END=1349 /DNA_ORIENTATION=-